MYGAGRPYLRLQYTGFDTIRASLATEQNLLDINRPVGQEVKDQVADQQAATTPPQV